jgi:hypothetical protein
MVPVDEINSTTVSKQLISDVVAGDAEEEFEFFIR